MSSSGLTGTVDIFPCWGGGGWGDCSLCKSLLFRKKIAPPPPPETVAFIRIMYQDCVKYNQWHFRVVRTRFIGKIPCYLRPFFPFHKSVHMKRRILSCHHPPRVITVSSVVDNGGVVFRTRLLIKFICLHLLLCCYFSRYSIKPATLVARFIQHSCVIHTLRSSVIWNLPCNSPHSSSLNTRPV